VRSTPTPQLFAGGRLSEALAAAAKSARDKLAAWPPDDLLNTPEADVTEQLVRLASVEMPSLVRREAQQEPPLEISVESRDLGPRSYVTVTRFTLVVPITGVSLAFQMTARRTAGSVVSGVVDSFEGLLRLRCDDPVNGDEARAYFERTLDQIEQRLEWTQADIQAHNQQMARQLPNEVAQRRAKLLRDRDLQASIGYPIMMRPDAETHQVPVKRKKITPDHPRRSSGRSNAYVPEPAIDQADYEVVLAVLRNARNALERSPSISAKLDEEEIRDLLLIYLNGQLEGKATGETFNYMGKTDILVRDGDRNVFIGECKIFDSKNKQSVEHVVTSAIDQLLNCYLAWRDTKAALLLFIRDSNVTAVVDKALTAICGHPNHKRPGEISTEERHDFVLHANGDANREVHLAFLPFLIGSR
jgi:hypothetical protein